MTDKLLDNDIIAEILNKSFAVEFKGYETTAVDEFLDYLAVNIKNYQQTITRLNYLIKEQKFKLSEIETKLQKSHDEIALLRSQKQALEAKGVQNVDIITRLSKLEHIVNKD